ncbi:MAG: hypothetical protein ACRC5M_07380, partial [Anaeroplasmataceae bacterium]
IELTDINNFAFDMGGVFILPKKIDKLTNGDIVVRNNETFIVNDATNLTMVNIETQKQETIVKVKNMFFGTEFVRVITSPLSMFGNNGGMTDKLMPLMLMGGMNGTNGQGGLDMTTFMMMSIMNGESSDKNSMLPFMMMSMGGNQQGQAQNQMLPFMMMSMMENKDSSGFGGMFDMFSSKKEEPVQQEKTLEELVEEKVQAILVKMKEVDKEL